MSQNNPVSDFTNTAMENLKALVDVNTVVGDPITPCEGITILPISKVSFGYGTGGSELPSKVPDKFLGGTGGGVTLQPLGFLVIQGETVKILHMDTADNTGDRLVNAGANVVDRILDFVPSKDKKGKKDEKDTKKATKEETIITETVEVTTNPELEDISIEIMGEEFEEGMGLD